MPSVPPTTPTHDDPAETDSKSPLGSPLFCGSCKHSLTGIGPFTLPATPTHDDLTEAPELPPSAWLETPRLLSDKHSLTRVGPFTLPATPTHDDLTEDPELPPGAWLGPPASLSFGVGDFVGVCLTFSFDTVFLVPVGVSSLLLSLLLLLLLRLLLLRSACKSTSESLELEDVSTCIDPWVNRTAGAAGCEAALRAD